MPTTPLIDFEALDLTQTVGTPEDLKKYLKQRGTFELLDGVLHQGPEDELTVGFKDIRADDWWCADHIPGRPLFPGALMIETAAQLASYDYLRYRGDLSEDQFVGFGGLDKTRFRAAVTPGCRMIFAAQLLRSRRSMFVYECQAFVDQKIVFECEVMGVVV
jgi:3-hydroxyacyl-[acyl-carrier-protein] dehydratase